MTTATKTLNGYNHYNYSQGQEQLNITKRICVITSGADKKIITEMQLHFGKL